MLSQEIHVITGSKRLLIQLMSCIIKYRERYYDSYPPLYPFGWNTSNRVYTSVLSIETDV